MLLGKLLDAPRLPMRSFPRKCGTFVVDGLDVLFSSLVVGAISCSVIGLIASYRGRGSLAYLALVCGSASLGRGASHPRGLIATRGLTRRRRCGAGSESTDRRGAVRRAPRAPGVPAQFRSNDLAAHLVTATTAAGYAAGITGRNAGRPYIALSQVVLAMVPLAVALMISHDSLHSGSASSSCSSPTR